MCTILLCFFICLFWLLFENCTFGSYNVLTLELRFFHLLVFVSKLLLWSIYVLEINLRGKLKILSGVFSGCLLWLSGFFCISWLLMNVVVLNVWLLKMKKGKYKGVKNRRQKQGILKKNPLEIASAGGGRVCNNGNKSWNNADHLCEWASVIRRNDQWS